MNAAAVLSYADALPLLDTLDDGRGCLIPRTARKAWRCTCADRLFGFTIVCPWGDADGNPRGESSFSLGRHVDRAAAEAIAADKVGAVAAWDCTVSPSVPSGWVLSATVVERLNPNYREGCRGSIEPGDRCIEYVGESVPWESGPRYCAPCAVAAWGPA